MVPKIPHDEHYYEIDKALSNNDEVTSRQLRAMLISKWPCLSMSISTVERARREMGWVVTTVDLQIFGVEIFLAFTPTTKIYSQKIKPSSLQ